MTWVIKSIHFLKRECSRITYINSFLITRRRKAIKYRLATLDVTSDTLVSIVSYRSVDSTEITLVHCIR